MAKKNGSTPPGNGDDSPAELSRLHRLTHEEAELVFGYRLLPPPTQRVVSGLVEKCITAKPCTGNVVSIGKRPQ